MVRTLSCHRGRAGRALLEYRLDTRASLVNGSYVVRFNEEIITYPNVTESPCSDETNTHFYIDYTHSEHAIEISGTTTIPEFSALHVLLMLMLLALPAASACKRKRSLGMRRN